MNMTPQRWKRRTADSGVSVVMIDRPAETHGRRALARCAAERSRAS